MLHVPIRRSDNPNVVVKTPGTPPPPSAALMHKIHRAEKGGQADEGAAVPAEKAGAALAAEAIKLEAQKRAVSDPKLEKKNKDKGVRGPNYQPIGMDPRQAKALGVLVTGEDVSVSAEQELDQVWYSLTDKQRLAAGRTERFRVDMDQKLLRMARSTQAPHLVKGQLSMRTIERGRRNATAELIRYQHLLADDVRALLDRFIVETYKCVEQSYRADSIRGAPAEDLAELQCDLVRKLVYQEVQSRLRRMGDRGVRHILGNIFLQEKLMEALEPHVELGPRDRLLGRVAQVHHDLGYTCHAAQVSYQAGRMHRHYSARIFNDEWNRYRKVIPPRDLQRVRDAVALHAHLDFNLTEDPLGAVTRIADHLMPFAPYWTYPKLMEVPRASELCDTLLVAAKAGERAAMVEPKVKLWDAVMRHPGFGNNFKEDLLSGLRPFDKGAYLTDLGAWAGEFSGARYDPKAGVLQIAVTQSDVRRHLQSVFDCGQDQLFFFARKRGATDDQLRSGQTLALRCRENGPLALQIFVGALPEKKLDFKKRGRESIRGAL